MYIIINLIYCLHASSLEDIPKSSNLSLNLFFPIIFNDSGPFTRILVVDLFKVAPTPFHIRSNYQIQAFAL